jgi:ankyrin repeat protein
MESLEKSKKENDKLLTSKQEAEKLYKKIWLIAGMGEINKLQLIHDQGFDLDVKASDNGSTPLMYAAQNGRVECINFLIGHGADVNAVNNNGLTALHFATDSHNSEVIKVLIKHGAKVNTSDLTPLHRAIQRDCSISLIQVLLENGATKCNINAQTSLGNTPLHLAIKASRLDVITELVNRGYNANVQTKDGDTPLHFAVIKSLDMVKLLLKMGADPNLKNNNGEIPLIVAAKHHKHDIVAELASHMASNKS